MLNGFDRYEAACMPQLRKGMSSVQDLGGTCGDLLEHVATESRPPFGSRAEGILQSTVRQLSGCRLCWLDAT